ncbi:fungal-specific transcription factor domain-containing protein [Mycena rosella]|uniref:Fungal-specific transcription factor domain-containing protein n=1 Tax=Mycena rosella TaxID=1033263 RepID=A0AAD7GGX6_MYCRO|nr:fungal-specific transcription factor domain-containing protein [Mycena rosella]
MSSLIEDTQSPEDPGNLVEAGDQPVIRDPLTGLIAPTKAERFYGKSSSVQFVKSAIKHIHGSTSIVVGVQRPEFWTAQPWEKLVIDVPQQIFPENDLVTSLVNLYFEQINPMLGILHFPSFCQSIKEGLHFRDQDFGAVVLGVCALASRSSDDPRVLLEGVNSQHSAGWKWFRQVRPLRASFSPEPSLLQLQLICLSVLYLAGTSNPEECWILAGLGLRFAQGAGAHHRGGYSHMKPLDAELYKRVFYILLISDIIMSSFKGRPCITHSIDFDLDLPFDCDEENWGIPNALQPPGKPSTSAFLVSYLPLIMIFGRIQRAVYPVNGQLPSTDTIAELDSELNKWVDALPAHLRWDPNQENQVMLFLSFVGPLSHAKLQIFILQSAAFSGQGVDFEPRSCGHVLAAQTRRCGGGLLHLPQVMTVLFDCATVLLINVWAIVGKSRTEERYNRATADVQNCVRVLRLYERRWRVAGRKCDIISAMLNIGKYTSDAPSLKRPRDMEEVEGPLNISASSSTPLEERSIAGTSRVMSVDQQIQALELSIQETDHLFPLPLHTEELGCLPIYDSFDHSFTFQSNELQYQSQAHMDLQYEQAFGPIEPEFLAGLNPLSAIGSNFPTPQNGGTPSGEEIPLEYSFDIPSGFGWRDWSTYLTNMDGLNREEYSISDNC